MDVFAVLAEPVRYRIIEIIATGEHSSTLVADVLHHEFGVSHSAVSKHLKILVKHNFAVVRVQERYRLYRLSADALDQVDAAVDALHGLWDARYGWPYLTDPLSMETMPTFRPPSRGRGQRGRSTAPVIVQINEDNDPWQWMGD